MDIYKDKLPAGWSYALSPPRLNSALADKGVLLPVSLHQRYKVWDTKTPALSATFYPRGSYLGGEVGSISVSSCAIPSDQRQTQREFAEAVFLPALISWAWSLETLPLESTIRREEQQFTCDGSPLALSKRPLPNIPKGQRIRKV